MQYFHFFCESFCYLNSIQQCLKQKVQLNSHNKCIPSVAIIKCSQRHLHLFLGWGVAIQVSVIKPGFYHVFCSYFNIVAFPFFSISILHVKKLINDSLFISFMTIFAGENYAEKSIKHAYLLQIDFHINSTILKLERLINISLFIAFHVSLCYLNSIQQCLKQKVQLNSHNKCIPSVAVIKCSQRHLHLFLGWSVATQVNDKSDYY